MTHSRAGIHIGGLGTGALVPDENGRTSLYGVIKYNARKNIPDAVNPLSFVLYAAKEGKEALCRLLCRDEDIGDAFSDGEFSHRLCGAFCHYTFRTPSLTVNERIFNPRLIGNAVDSGIPAAILEFTVENTSDVPIHISLVGRVRSFFGRQSVRIAYFPGETAFFAGLGNETDVEGEPSRHGGLGLACDASDFTYAALSRINDDAFLRTVRAGFGFLTNTGVSADNLLLAAHKVVSPREKVSVRFIFTWFFPIRSETENSYYHHYFNDEAACASYVFANYDRLLAGTEQTSDLLCGGAAGRMLPDIVPKALAADTLPMLYRGADGHIENPESVSGAAELLFGQAFYDAVKADIVELISGKSKMSMFDTALSYAETMRRMTLLTRYFAFRRMSREIDTNEEYDADIASLADNLFESADKLSCSVREWTRLLSAKYMICTSLAAILGLTRAKKRTAAYEAAANEVKASLGALFGRKAGKYASLILTECGKAYMMLGHAPFDEALIDAAVRDCRFEKDSADYYLAAALIRRRQYDAARLYTSHIVKNGVTDGLLAMLMSLGGFSYDAADETLVMCPADAYRDENNVTRAFFAAVGTYGVIEQGEDYIELRVRYGSLAVRRVTVSHRPYVLHYRSRALPCTIDGNTVTFESALIIDADRKLTILVDVTK